MEKSKKSSFASNMKELEAFPYLENFLPIDNKRFIIMDTETTGKFKDVDHAIQICAIEIINGKIIDNTLMFFDIKPRISIKKEATNIHGISNSYYNSKYLKNPINEKQLIKNLYDFIGKDIIICHNCPFDFVMINKEFEHNKLNKLPRSQFSCTMSAFRRFTKEKVYNLEFCCNYFKIQMDLDKSHNADEDTKRCAKLLVELSKLFKEKNGSSNIEGEKIVEITNKDSIHSININSSKDEKVINEEFIQLEVDKRLKHFTMLNNKYSTQVEELKNDTYFNINDVTNIDKSVDYFINENFVKSLLPSTKDNSEERTNCSFLNLNEEN